MFGLVVVADWSRFGDGATMSTSQSSTRAEVDLLAEEVREFAKHADAKRSDLIAQLMAAIPHLQALPAVQEPHRSGPRGQIKAIKQAIDSSVGRLDSRERPAARELLGLTPSSRGKTWTARQRTAGELLGLHYEYFRKEPTKSLLREVADNLTAMPRDKGRARRTRPAAPRDPNRCSTPKIPGIRDVKTFRDQDQLEPQLLRYIKAARPGSATLLEYSSLTANPVLKSLRDAGCKTRLLMSHPEAAPTDWQRDRIKVAAQNLRDIKFRGNELLEVRFYRTPPSLRGRRIGDYVIVGWYTYRDDLGRPLDDPEQIAVWGHDNLVIVGDTRTEEGVRLASWFEREYERLWHHRQTLQDDALYSSS